MQHVKKSGVGHSKDFGHGVNFGSFFGASSAALSSGAFSVADGRSDDASSRSLR